MNFINLSGPRPPTIDEIVKKKQLASAILEHLITEGLVPELVNLDLESKNDFQKRTSESQTKPDH